ncbi:immunity 49 family protein [Salinilacihabitans rarus]|uniref:immunity 49 family protein n=1 Tax=Salinilacihabitans rarus TaxID=2961596 RepID=UPI0020C8D78D|nr:immunity 49 family protein [Salinilacihabitans rarus]
MREFTEDQREQVRTLLGRNERRIERKKELQREGQVADEKISTFYSGLARKYRTVGILSIPEGRVSDARRNFSAAAAAYLRSARESSVDVFASLSLARGIYAAALAGDDATLRACAERVRELHREYDPDATDPHADRFYFAGCLAGAVVDEVTDDELATLEEVNERKPETEALYGRAIIDFTTGVRDDDRDLIETAVRTMLEYHERRCDDVVDLIMAPEATALLLVARSGGYDVDVTAEFLPAELIDPPE